MLCDPLLFIVAIGWVFVSVELRPLTGPLSSTHVIHEWIWSSGGCDVDRGKPKDSEKNLSQCHSVHHKSHMDCPGREPENGKKRKCLSLRDNSRVVTKLCVIIRKALSVEITVAFICLKVTCFVAVQCVFSCQANHIAYYSHKDKALKVTSNVIDRAL
jgi:hypothetical protein